MYLLRECIEYFFQSLVQRIKFDAGASFGIYLKFDPENIELDQLIAIGLENGEILILSNENIISKRRDFGSSISYLDSSNDLLVAATEKSIFFYQIQKDDCNLNKIGFIQNLNAPVISVDISGDNQ